MSITIDLTLRPGRPRFRIKLQGIRTRFYAKDGAEIALALDHYFRDTDTDPRHWGDGMPRCPLCKGYQP